MVNLPDLAIPAVINPENTRCICLQIPDDETWITNFVNLLSIPTFWFNWQRTGDTTGKQLADVWFDLFVDIDWSVMSCCCDQPPAIFRYNSEGVYQRSTDGGVTWVDAPEYDYRNTSIIFPPPSALGFDNTKCQNADSAVVILNEDVIQGLDNGSAVQAILEFIAAVLIFYLSAGTLATVAIGLFSMAAAIFGFGVAATKAAFTSTILDQLRCSIFNAMNSDDSIDAAGLTALLVDINDNYTGIVKTSLYSIISAAGVTGVTNMIRSNRGDAAADCSDCVPCTGYDSSMWVINPAGDYGAFVEETRTCNYMEIIAHNRGDGIYNACVLSTGTSDCVLNMHATAVSGLYDTTQTYYNPCGSPPSDISMGLHQNNNIHEFCLNAVIFQALGPFTVALDSSTGEACS